MLTAKSVFSKFRNRRLSYAELRKQLAEIIADNADKVPAEVGTTDLFKVANNNKWLSQKPDGTIVVKFHVAKAKKRSGSR